MTFETLRRRLSNAGIVVCVSLIILFAGDFLVLRIRIAAQGVAGVTQKVTTFQAALLKDNKFNVYFDQPQIQTCVRSIFPWLDDTPCWYVRRHTVNILN
jgi:hypothetical protein